MKDEMQTILNLDSNSSGSAKRTADGTLGQLRALNRFTEVVTYSILFQC